MPVAPSSKVSPANEFRAQARERPGLHRWTLDNRVITQGARPGRWRDLNAPFTPEIFHALDDEAVREAVLIAPTQLMKTELAITVCLWGALHGEAVLLYEPDLPFLQDFMADRIRPALLATDPLALTPAERGSRTKKRDSLMSLRIRGGGGITGLTAGQKSADIGRTARIAVVDELDRCQAPKLRQAVHARTSSFGGSAILLFVSSPTAEEGPGLIWPAWREGSRGVWRARCPRCGDLVSCRWGRVAIEKDRDGWWIPESARLVCEACSAEWSEPERIRAVRAGCYVHERPDHPVRTFHVPGAAHLWRSIEQIARHGAEAHRAMRADSIDVYRGFINEWAAEPWSDEYEGLSARRLSTATYAPGPRSASDLGALDPRVTLITIGADVGAHAIDVEWVGWGFDLEHRRVLAWGLQYRTIGGSPDDDIEDPAMWAAFAGALAEARWRHPLSPGATIGFQRGLIDCRYRPEIVREWCERRYRDEAPRGSVLTEFGSTLLPCAGKPIARRGAPPLDLVAQSKSRTKIRRRPSVVWIDTLTLKDAVYDALLMDRRLPADIAPAHRWPDPCERYGYTSRWFDELASEVRDRRRTNRGELVTEWRERRGRAKGNEAWDCRIYAYAAAMVQDHPRMSLPDHLAEREARRPAASNVVPIR